MNELMDRSKEFQDFRLFNRRDKTLRDEQCSVFLVFFASFWWIWRIGSDVSSLVFSNGVILKVGKYLFRCYNTETLMLINLLMSLQI